MKTYLPKIHNMYLRINRPYLTYPRILHSPSEYKGNLKNKIHAVIIPNNTPFDNIHLLFFRTT